MNSYTLLQFSCKITNFVVIFNYHYQKKLMMSALLVFFKESRPVTGCQYQDFTWRLPIFFYNISRYFPFFICTFVKYEKLYI